MIVVSLIYVDRLLNKHPYIKLTYHSIHRLIATSVLIAIKTHQDDVISNQDYALKCGLGLKGKLIVYLLRHYVFSRTTFYIDAFI